MNPEVLNTALIFAAAAGDAARCGQLLEAGADADASNRYGNTPLIMAAQHGDVATLACILAHRPRLDHANQTGNTALLYAAYQGRERAADRLIDSGADVNARNQHGASPLIYAAYSGHLGIVSSLLRAGASIDAGDEEGRTALIWAAIRGKPEVRSSLIAAGTDVDHRDATGMTAEDWARMMEPATLLVGPSVRQRSVTIRTYTAAEATAAQARLVAILQDAVRHGASVGYLEPLPDAEAAAYWSDVIASLGKAQRVLLMAEVDGTIAGTVQLVLESRPNGRHRAEVSKLLIHSHYRRLGIATQLMQAVEVEARTAGRSLLFLDTAGADAEALYRKLGYRAAGALPNYALDPDGTPAATVIMYKELHLGRETSLPKMRTDA